MQVSGHPAVAPHMTKFYGIRNGIDQDIWDPLEDRFLPRSAQTCPRTPLGPRSLSVAIYNRRTDAVRAAWEVA